MKFMLDTNMCIYLMKQQPPEVQRHFEQCYVGDVVMSSITLAELRYGVECNPAYKKRNETALAALVEDIKVVSFDENSAKSYGIIRAAARERKRDALDKLIAAHAISLNVVLVTNNEQDFSDYSGLRVENWVHAATHQP